MFIATVVVSVLLALAAIGSALGKLSKSPKVVEGLTGAGVPVSWFPFLATAELAGGVGLLVGLGIAPLGMAAAIGLVLYFVGAVAAHVKAGDTKGIGAPLVLAIIAGAALALRIASA